MGNKLEVNTHKLMLLSIFNETYVAETNLCTVLRLLLPSTPQVVNLGRIRELLSTFNTLI